MLKEYDVVRSTKELNGLIKANTLGTIMLIISNEPAKYEVEFVNNNESLGTLTVGPSDIELVK